MIEKAIFKAGNLLEESRFAPYVGDVVFIINQEYIIYDDEIYKDFDIDYYKDIFEIIEAVQ